MTEFATSQFQSPNSAWQQIEQLIHELANLSQEDMAVRPFHAELLKRVVRATASVGGAIWCREDGRMSIDARVRMPAVAEDRGEEGPHPSFLEQAFELRAAASAQPGAALESGSFPTNPTEYLIILCPIVVGSDVVGSDTVAVVELFLDSDLSPATERGNRELLTAACELAADFHRNTKLRQMGQREEQWLATADFLRRIHEDIDPDTTAYVIANEGRLVLGCDRVSVLTYRLGKTKLRCISGLETFDSRSTMVRAMEELADDVMAVGQPLWWPGEDESQSGDRPAGLSRYMRHSQATKCGVLPLEGKADQSPSNETRSILLVEFFQPNGNLDFTKQRARFVAPHCASALRNANSVAELPLMPLVRWIHKLSWFTELKRLPATVVVLAAMVLMLLGLALVKTDFNVEARGELVPIAREVIYAPHDGIVTFPDPIRERLHAKQLHVDSGTHVMQLASSDLDYEMTTVAGELDTAKREFDTVDETIRKTGGRQITAVDKEKFDDLTARRLELTAMIESLEKRSQILRSQKDDLAIRTKQGGQVQTWDVVGRLDSRPVRQGQKLMTVVDPQGQWLVEVHVPDHHIGYVNAARRASKEPLDVTFIVRSDPSTTYHAAVVETGLAVEHHEVYGATIPVRSSIDQDKRPPDPRPGTTVIAKIQCGRASIGYVWLHDLIEAIRSRVLF